MMRHHQHQRRPGPDPARDQWLEIAGDVARSAAVVRRVPVTSSTQERSLCPQQRSQVRGRTDHAHAHAIPGPVLAGMARRHRHRHARGFAAQTKGVRERHGHGTRAAGMVVVAMADHDAVGRAETTRADRRQHHGVAVVEAGRDSARRCRTPAGDGGCAPAPTAPAPRPAPWPGRRPAAASAGTATAGAATAPAPSQRPGNPRGTNSHSDPMHGQQPAPASETAGRYQCAPGHARSSAEHCPQAMHHRAGQPARAPRPMPREPAARRRCPAASAAPPPG